MTDFETIRREYLFEVMDKFPNAGSLTIAKIVYNQHPEFYASIESARNVIRYYRGSYGEHGRKYLKIKKYAREQI